jgi:hypothetical protein
VPCRWRGSNDGSAAGATRWQGNTELEGEIGAVVEVVERSRELTCFLIER